MQVRTRARARRERLRHEPGNQAVSCRHALQQPPVLHGLVDGAQRIVTMLQRDFDTAPARTRTSACRAAVPAPSPPRTPHRTRRRGHRAARGRRHRCDRSCPPARSGRPRGCRTQIELEFTGEHGRETQRAPGARWRVSGHDADRRAPVRQRARTWTASPGLSARATDKAAECRARAGRVCPASPVSQTRPVASTSRARDVEPEDRTGHVAPVRRTARRVRAGAGSCRARRPTDP